MQRYVDGNSHTSFCATYLRSETLQNHPDYVPLLESGGDGAEPKGLMDCSAYFIQRENMRIPEDPCRNSSASCCCVKSGVAMVTASRLLNTFFLDDEPPDPAGER